MEILDKHFIGLPSKSKIFIILIGIGYFLVGLTAYVSKLTNLVESLLIIAVGIVFTELLKMQCRVEKLEKKKRI